MSSRGTEVQSFAHEACVGFLFGGSGMWAFRLRFTRVGLTVGCDGVSWRMTSCSEGGRTRPKTRFVCIHIWVTSTRFHFGRNSRFGTKRQQWNKILGFRPVLSATGKKIDLLPCKSAFRQRSAEAGHTTNDGFERKISTSQWRTNRICTSHSPPKKSLSLRSHYVTIGKTK